MDPTFIIMVATLVIIGLYFVARTITQSTESRHAKDWELLLAVPFALLSEEDKRLYEGMKRKLSDKRWAHTLDWQERTSVLMWISQYNPRRQAVDSQGNIFTGEQQ